MERPERERIIDELGHAFGAATDVTPRPSQPLHVLIPKLELPAPWQPSPTRALTTWEDWPAQRPLFLIDPAVVGESGSRPRSHNLVYQLGEPWLACSLAFSWGGRDSVRAVQRWMTRFVRSLRCRCGSVSICKLAARSQRLPAGGPGLTRQSGAGFLLHPAEPGEAGTYLRSTGVLTLRPTDGEMEQVPRRVDVPVGDQAAGGAGVGALG